MSNNRYYSLCIVALLLHHGYAESRNYPEYLYETINYPEIVDIEYSYTTGDYDEGRTPPPVLSKFVSESAYETTTVGGSVTFHCDTRNTDNVVRVWKKGEEQIIFSDEVRVLGDERFQILNKTSLRIEGVQPRDNGEYICAISTDPPIQLTHRLKVTSRPSVATPCPNKSPRWIDLGGDFCYIIETETNDRWTDAVYKCSMEGGHLASFHSIEEIKRVLKYLKYSEGRLHIGLRKHNDGSFEWVDKSVLDYRKWDRGEPSSRDEPCIEIYTESGVWNDIHCDKRMGYICASPKGSSPPILNKVCPDTSANWTDFGGDKCYIIQAEETVTWHNASQRCSEEGGSLATFSSMEEITVLLQHTRDVYGTMHIGLRQNQDGEFEWVDKSTFDLNYWDFGEPNADDEMCGEMYPTSGEWNDIPCTKYAFYVCSVRKVDVGISAKELALSKNLVSPNICGEDIISANGTIHSPNYPESYNPNQNCLWKITVPENFQVALNFHVIEVEYGANCDYDYIEIIDGHDAGGTVLRKLCGSDAPLTASSSGNKMSIKFVSDAERENIGFFADFTKKELCGGNIVSEEGTIQSRNFPSNYIANDLCEWKITVPDTYKVLLKFKAFETEEGGGCNYDYVEILDGHDSTSRVLGRFCGSYIPEDVISSGHKITVKFGSDYAKEYYGFSADFIKITVSIPSVAPTTEVDEDTYAQCGGDLISETGVLLSPNYPGSYRDNLECNWRITVPNNYLVVLRFKTMSLEYHRSCNYDKVEVFDGHDQSSERLGTFCGSKIPNDITSSGNQMAVRFTSDSSGSSTGFAAVFKKGYTSGSPPEYTSEEEICGENLVADEGVVQSPNYPENYGPNKRCTWKITVSEGHQVSLKFVTFKVEVHDTCAYDYVEIRDGHASYSPIIAKLCGYDIPQDIVSSGNQLMVSFKSDSSSQYNGFSAEFKKGAILPKNETAAIPGVCGGEIYASSGNISSPNYPNNYPALLNCTWTITVPEDQRVILTLWSTIFEYHVNCGFDALEILDGHDSNSQVLRKICGQGGIDIFRSSNNTMTIKFVSDDSVESSGFAASFRSGERCGGDIFAEEGIIQSPNYPGDYSAGEYCKWNITVPENYTVSFQFMTLNVSCPDDVTVWDTEYYQTVGRFCGSEIPNSVFTRGNKVEVTFTSDATGGGKGFSIKFRKMERCGANITAEKGIIGSPKYPDGYQPAQHCKWKITVPVEYRVQLNFLTFDVDCEGGAVKVHGYRSGYDMENICGSDIPPSVLSNNNEMEVEYLSDGSGARNSFSIEFQKDMCGGEITADSGAISSENYPDNYPESETCIWKITVPENHEVVLEFKGFFLESCLNCGCDALEIRDGHHSDSPLLGTFCGASLPEAIRSSSEKMFVKFRTDSSLQYSGFKANFRKGLSPEAELASILRQFPSMISREKGNNPEAESDEKNPDKITRIIRSLLKK